MTRDLEAFVKEIAPVIERLVDARGGAGRRANPGGARWP